MHAVSVCQTADGVSSGDSRTHTAIVDDDCVLATFTKEDYLRIFMVGTVMEWTEKFWNLVTIEAYGHTQEDNLHDRIDFAAYCELHKRISKTIHDKSDFNNVQEKEDAKVDWAEDVERAHHGAGGQGEGRSGHHHTNADVMADALTKAEFCDALFQLVDVWCEHVDAMELFVEFLKALFGSISVFNRDQKCFRYKAIGQIKSMATRLEDIRLVTMEQFALDEQVREVKREEIHAKRGVESDGKHRLKGKIIRSSMLISVVGAKDKGLMDETTFQTDDSDVKSGDLADVKASIKKLKARTKVLVNFGAMDKDGPGSPKQKGKKAGERWLYGSKADWALFGVVNGGPVMVRVPNVSPSMFDQSDDEPPKDVWVHGTVIKVAPDSVTVVHSNGKTETLYSNNPASYGNISGFSVEFAAAGTSKDWQSHSPEVSNIILNAVDTEGVATFHWQPPVVFGQPLPKVRPFLFWPVCCDSPRCLTCPS